MVQLMTLPSVRSAQSDCDFMSVKFGVVVVTVCFHGRSFEWNFVIASVTVPIIGTNFLCGKFAGGCC